jgi:hypothetical protein
MAKKSLNRSIRQRKTKTAHLSTPLRANRRERDVCLELADYSVVSQSAVTFFGTEQSRDPNQLAARLTDQFIAQNRTLLKKMGVTATSDFNGQDVKLRLHSTSTVGAIPLFSPTSAVPDYGIVIQPRFPWAGIGPMLADMGWRIGPTPLKLPLLKRSERRVPPWVISSMVLTRLAALIKSLTRRFEVVTEDRSAPKGAVNWSRYATQRLSRGNVTSVPCSFPDLRDDSLLKGSIRFALEKHLRSLQTQREHGAFVHRLVDYCLQLIRQVSNVAARVPSPRTIESWLQRPMRTTHFLEGIQAIEWTAEDRGLAGLSDLEGIPWAMPMDKFFEAWLETVFQVIARRAGATLTSGRLRQTVHPIAWEQPFHGSQKALIPDIWLEWPDTTLIVDAKYKRHFQELQQTSWRDAEEQLREEHRDDLFQILAYAGLSSKQNVIACLAYPCNFDLWDELRQRNTLIHKARITGSRKQVQLWLTAVPMATSIETVSTALISEIRKAV